MLLCPKYSSRQTKILDLPVSGIIYEENGRYENVLPTKNKSILVVRIETSCFSGLQRTFSRACI